MPNITPEHLAQVDSFEALAKLFHEELNWPSPTWPTFEGVADLYGIPKADLPGVESLKAVRKLADETWGIFQVDFGANELRRSQLRAILNRVAEKARQAHDNPTWPHENILFLCRSQNTTWTLGHYEGEKPANAKLKTFGWSDASEARTARENLHKLEWPKRNGWAEAWDVERLSDAFFRELRERFGEIEALWSPPFTKDDRRTATQQLINRLLFVCFLQKKRWLELDGKREDYFFRLYQTTDTADQDGVSFSKRLEYLFFSGLNSSNETPGDRDMLARQIGRVPFLNGGLFERSMRYDTQHLPNRAFEKLLDEGGLLRSYNFTIEEATPLDVAVAIDPEMLGKIFEELVTGEKDEARHDTGAYYTPRPIVSFMCREALKGYLGGHERLVDDHDATGIDVPEARILLEKLEEIKFCDPACGSGAYLVGMLQEIFAIQRALDTAAHKHREDYERKLVVIENCLYGVDIEPYAVNIAWLRLWLALVIDNHSNPLDEPDADVSLPNLDMELAAGDSVASGNPQDAVVQTYGSKGQKVQAGFDYEGVETIVPRLIERRALYQKSHGGTKRDLYSEIQELKRAIQDRVHATGFAVNAFLWPIEFPEVFLSTSTGFVKGFDVVLANPPYVRQEKIRSTMGDVYKRKLVETYHETGSGTADLFIYFYTRGLQLLKPGGMFVYISSNKWFKAEYGTKLRRYVATATTILSITDFGELPVFKTALAYAMIFVAEGSAPPGGRQAPRFTQVKNLGPPYPHIKALSLADGFELPEDWIDERDRSQWTLAGAATLAKLRVMRRRGTPLAQLLLPAEIYRGIVTGYNEAFFIDGATRQRLIDEDPASAEVIKPLAIGDDIRRWRARNEDRWLIWLPWHYPLHEDHTIKGASAHAEEQFRRRLPAIYRHLLTYRRSLEARNAAETGIRYEWYALQRWGAEYWSCFDHPKIIYPVMCKEPRFAYDEAGTFTNDKAFIIPSSDLFLVGLLNSPTAWMWLKTKCSILMGNTIELRSIHMEKLPIVTPSATDWAAVKKLVRRVFEGHDSGADTSNLEAEIDARVDFLYFHQTGDESYDQWKARLDAEKGTLAGEIREMVRVDETDSVEFKETLEYVDRLDPNIPENKRSEKRAEKQAERLHEVLKTICGYINKDGGTLLIGVHNDRTLVGIEPDYKLFAAEKDRGPDGFERKLRDLADARLNKRPIGLLTVRFAELDGKTICRVDVKPDHEPFYLDGDYWLRDGNRTITLVEHERDEYIAKRRS